MNDLNVLKELFNEFVEGDNITIKQSGKNYEYTIKTRFKMTVIVDYESEDNLFYIDINYPNRDSYNLSSYNSYKDYDKKKTKKKLFGKKTITDHLATLAQYMHEHLSVLAEEDTASVFFKSEMRGYGKIFVE